MKKVFQFRVTRIVTTFLLILLLALAGFAQTNEEKMAIAGKAVEDAQVLLDKGNTESLKTAIEKFNLALNLFRSVSYKEGEAYALFGLGGAYNSLEEKGKAVDYFEQARLIYRAEKFFSNQAVAAQNLGLIYSSLGDNTTAYEYFIESIVLYRQLRDRASLIYALYNLGNVLESVDLERQKRGLDILIRSLEETRLIGDDAMEAIILSRIGFAYARLHNKEKALSYFEQSLSRTQKPKEKDTEAIVKISIAKGYSELGLNQKAQESFEQSLSFYQNAGRMNEAAPALIQFGKFYSKLSDYRRAIEYTQQALAIYQSNEDKGSEATALGDLMALWNQFGKPQQAIINGKRSINIYQQLRSNIQSLKKQTQKYYLQKIEPVYRNLSDILIAEGRLPEAQAVLDLLKDEEFLGLTRRTGEAAQSVPYSQAESATIKIIDQIALLGREKSELTEKNEKSSLSDDEKARFLELDKQISSAEAEFNKSLDALSKESGNSQSLETVTADAQAFMEDLGQLGKGTVALYTVLVNDSKPSADSEKATDAAKESLKTGWIILVTPEFRKAYPIDVKDLEKTVFAFRAALSSPKYNPQPLAETMYKKLFLHNSAKQTSTLAADLDEYFKNKPDRTLMWSLDGVLRYVPMSALHDGKNYLVEKYRNTVFNTASKARLKDAVKPKWTVFGLGVSQARNESGKKFPALEGAKRELEIIVKEKDSPQGILSGNIKLDETFTEDAMFNGLLFDKNPVVHIASHFSYQPADFNESFLLIGNGKLTVKELSAKSTLFSNVDLLTLSACETAVGGANGKDVEGFAYLAQSLGAKSVIATLWQVDDIGTQILMPEFYRLHETKLDKAEALRQAQRALLQGRIKDVPADLKRSDLASGGDEKFNLTTYQFDTNKPFAHPYYWSPFVLIGNWR